MEAGYPEGAGAAAANMAAGGGASPSSAKSGGGGGEETWQEERERLLEEIKTLQNRCQKLARAAASAASAQSPAAPKADAETQTETRGEVGAPSGGGHEGTSVGRLPPLVEQMLRNPTDEAVQMHGVDALFAEQTTHDSTHPVSEAALRGSLEAAVAIFSNHQGNMTLLLKAAQFVSVLLAEPDADGHLPISLLYQAAQDLVAIGGKLLVDVAAGVVAESNKPGSPPSASKLLTWFLSLLALLLPCLAPKLRDRTQGEAFVREFLFTLAAPLLFELPQEALILKCAQLFPLLPMEPWVQAACVDSKAVHGLALAYHRNAGGEAGDVAEAPLPKAVCTAVRRVFYENLELCVRAVEDMFVSDAFVCLEVLTALRELERHRRGVFVALDEDFGIVGKALRLWAFHERAALEAADPPRSASRCVLGRLADLLSAVCLKLPPQRLLHRMEEFREVELFQRVALAAMQSSAQLRLQMAVNYADNGIVPVIIEDMQMFLRRCKRGAPVDASPEPALRLLQDAKLPCELWPYLIYCLDACIHILSHWSATKASLRQKASVLDERAAPLLLAQEGLVDVLAEIVEPAAAGVDLARAPPADVVQKASDTLQALFEQNGHICLFCIQHFTEVRQMIALGCDSLAIDPLVEFPEMQQQAVEQLAASFERFSVQDDRLGRKILRALSALFESSYHLVAWFLRTHPLSSLARMQSLDVHTEAVRAVARAPYWSADDAAMLPEFVTLIAELLLGSIEGLGPEDKAPPPGRRVFDLTEAEEVTSCCMSAVMHLVLIDPSPPTVLRCLSESLAQRSQGDDGDTAARGDLAEQAVGAVMRVMQVFASSDRVQMNCQHLLTSLLGE